MSDINTTTPGDGFNLAADLLNSDRGDDVDKKPSFVPPAVNNTCAAAEPLVIHAGAVVSMLHLLPSIVCQQQPQVIRLRPSY